MLLNIALDRIFRTFRKEVGEVEDAELLQEIIENAPAQTFSVKLAKHCCSDIPAMAQCNESELDGFLDRCGHELAQDAIRHTTTCKSCTLPGYASRSMKQFIIHYALHLAEEDLIKSAIPAILETILSSIASEVEGETREEKPKSPPHDDLRSRLRCMKPEDFGKC